MLAYITTSGYIVSMRCKFKYIETRKIFDSRGVKLTWVAQEVGVSKNAIYRWFNGKTNPSYVYVKTMAEILGLKPEDLIAS